MQKHTRKIITILLFPFLLLVGCSADIKQAQSIRIKVKELTREHPVTDAVARIHYIGGKIAILNEQDSITLEIDPVSKINKITVAIFASPGLEIGNKRLRHESSIEKSKLYHETIRFIPTKPGIQNITLYILLDTAAHGMVSRIVTIPVRSGE